MKKLTMMTATLAALATLAPEAGVQAQEPITEIEIVVSGGYTPERIEVPAGTHVRLRFVRQEYSGCTREVAFPGLGIRRELPPYEPTIVDLGVLAPGEHEYRCGMNMIHGRIVVLG